MANHIQIFKMRGKATSFEKTRRKNLWYKSAFKRLMSRKLMKIKTIDVEDTIENAMKLLKNDSGVSLL